MSDARNYTKENVGNVISFEHVNVHIPDQATATLFYVLGLGLTRDPYMWVGLENMWINVGEQQFHLPTRRPQVIRGHIGLVVPDLDELQARLKAVQDRLAGTRFAWSAVEDQVAVTCPWGNRFRCYAPGPRFGDMALGIPYVDFHTRRGTARGIARFYETAMSAPSSVEAESDLAAARIEIGRNQWLLFRETDEPIAPYDGHHIAVYVANFSGPYEFFKRRNLIMEEAEGHQFRFKDVVDPESGERLFELEHEVRSLRHPLYHRLLVNRNPNQVQRTYRRGDDAVSPFIARPD